MAFVWPAQQLRREIISAARGSGSEAVFDFTGQDLFQMRRALEQAGEAAAGAHLKISFDAFLDKFLNEVVSSAGVGGLWVELPLWRSQEDAAAFWARVQDLSRIAAVFPICGDVDQISLGLKACPELSRLALKGSEASGWVGRDTIFILYAAIKGHIRDLLRKPDLYIWGGVATPEAAAAFWSTGARGIVCESLHWLTDLMDLEAEVREGLARLKPDHTELVGEALDCPVRLFNRGNSLAVKALKESMAPEDSSEARRAFVQQVEAAAVHPLESRFHREELIPLGVEAAFAEDFADRFGSDSGAAIRAFQGEAAKLLRQAQANPAPFVNSLAARELGATYPIIQGAMTWITDVPEFARAVADAGGLPTLALGMMDREIITQRLGSVRELLGDSPYGVNFLALPENPCREEQLAWIREARPRFVTIAAGEPGFARELQGEGLEVMYLAPDESLVRLACQNGIRYLILEGQEAGGHVGLHSTLTLAQIVLTLKRREPELLTGRRLILAGGIHNRETAFMAALLGADAIQVGTAYLATREIVETGALAALYQRQILSAPFGGTAITGEAVGLRVRSLKTPKIAAIRQREKELAAKRGSEAEIRKEMEVLAAGSLLVAARGIKRPGEPPLNEAACLEEGQFMSGACAGGLSRVRTVKELHQELVAGLALTPVKKVAEEQSSAIGRSQAASAVYRHDATDRLVVTGMALVNSLGNSPEEVWSRCLALKSGIIPVPAERWDHSYYYDPRPRVQDKTYCKVGAFHNFTATRKELGIPPQDFRTMTTATRLTLWLAAQAIAQSNLLGADIPRERISVLISQNSGEATATLSDIIIRGKLKEILDGFGKVAEGPSQLRNILAREIDNRRVAIDDTTLLGRLSCTAGGFISNKYGFMGPSFAVTAACATSLVALYAAVLMLRSGIIDAAVVGGGEEDLTPMHFQEFSALGALAGLSGREVPPAESSRPFDLTRDGMVLGEGGALIVVERESSARRRGAPILAYITGIGASNNHLGLVESSRVTQEIALRAAFQDLPYGPEDIGLVECHATSTFQGDVEEVLALKTFFAGRGDTVLSSFKSQIGHTLGASGLNSLIRGIMAMHAGVFPPTLNYRHPDPDMALEGSGLRITTEPEDWPQKDGRPRRFQVNSFGFGGSNYVVHLEQPLDGQARVLVDPTLIKSGAVQETDASLPAGVFPFQVAISNFPYRAAVVAESRGEALSRVREIKPGPPNQELSAKTLRGLALQGVFLASAGASAEPLAMVFPGQGSQYPGMGQELYDANPVIRKWLDRAAAAADFDLLNLLFFDREENLQKTRWQQPATFSLEFAMAQYLLSLGLKPAALAGHSLGELVALATAGVFSFEDGFRLVNMRARCMDKACDLSLDPGIMVATDAPLELLREKLEARKDIHITNINAPNQIVLGGATAPLQSLSEALKELGYRATTLKVSMAFHSPVMRVIREELQRFVDTLAFHPPSLPVISNTTRRPFPDDTRQIKSIIMDHLESPVYWLDNVRTLWTDWGARVFLEVGPGDVLSNLIALALEEAVCFPTCLPEREVFTLNQAVARLLAGGQLPFPAQAERLVLPEALHRAAAAVEAPTADSPPQSNPETKLVGIVQREINKFVLETFGRFLKPAILEAVRREYDPSFAEGDLERVLKEVMPSGLADAVNPGAVPAGPASDPGPAIAPPPVAAAVPPPAAEPLDVLEEVIRIIMEATGYERDEIEPDMDLRGDLAIRSSRMPVIVDTAENRFGIEIRLEEFMEVRTVRDLAVKIEEVRSQTQGGPAQRPNASAVPEKIPDKPTAPAPESDNLGRLVFQHVPLESGNPEPLELAPGARVAILTLENGDSCAPLKTVFQQKYGVSCEVLSIADVARHASLPDGPPLMGVVYWLSGESASGSRVEDLPQVLTQCFKLLQALALSPQRRFTLVLQQGGERQDLLAQGLLGMFLSAAQEMPSVLFRSMILDREMSELGPALEAALDRHQPVIETLRGPDSLLTLAGRAAPAPYRAEPQLVLGPEDVIVFSGGGHGITPYLARALAPWRPRLVLLGRTGIDLAADILRLLEEPEPSLKALRWAVMQARPDISQDDLSREISRLLRAKEVNKTLKDLRAEGLEVDYQSCDVADPEAVRQAVETIVARYGRIDGMVHGAGILRDAFLERMVPDDFAEVVKVKLLGAWNLFQTSRSAGLRFFAALSSAAAIQGNPGQSNYAAANRMMSALLVNFHRQHPEIICKALMLPAVARVGMASGAEIRKILEKKGIGYIEPEELAELFLRELCLAPPEDVWVLFKRRLPSVKTVILDESGASEASAAPRAGTLSFAPDDFPLIDSVSRIDLHQGGLTAHRTFSRERDLWIEDHKPFKFLPHPLVSTIMVLEAFLEAARLLYPYLQPTCIKDVNLREMVLCPPGISRDSRIICRRVRNGLAGVTCELSMETPAISPTGRVLDVAAVNFEARVLMGAARPQILPEIAGLPVHPEELDIGPMPHEMVLKCYRELSDMKNRYEVMEEVEGIGRNAIRASFRHRFQADFAGAGKVAYQYSPYVLEALLHLPFFHVVMREQGSKKFLIPKSLGELAWTRPCRDGERLILEGRLKQEDRAGVTFDARALDDAGIPIMQVRDLALRWFEG
ncbi:MAG: SDR family NAD(P)-dependent oxidoreductase [Deltaproteobacteria bacterium]|nr:SDR family NAD(P)-dependent oxidoreductase [Deltaproteobacteria bacterium]